VRLVGYLKRKVIRIHCSRSERPTSGPTNLAVGYPTSCRRKQG